MIPSNEDFLESRAQWRGEHHGVSYDLSWHGRSKHAPHGTWCYYIHVNSQQFYPDDWARLRLTTEDKQFSIGGAFHRHWSYDTFPDLDAHGGWTFGEMDTFLGRDGKEYEHVKVGCDYAHLWDHEGDFWQGRSDVERDAKHSIDMLVEMFPRRRERCAYTGQYDDSEQFYTAINGGRVHKSQEEELRNQGWKEWLPAPAA